MMMRMMLLLKILYNKMPSMWLYLTFCSQFFFLSKINFQKRFNGFISFILKIFFNPLTMVMNESESETESERKTSTEIDFVEKL